MSGEAGRELPWVRPEEWFAAVASSPGDLAFCHSSLKTGYSGDRSFLAFDPLERYAGASWEDAAAFLARDKGDPAPSTFGYFAYEMVQALERISPTRPAAIVLPAAQWVRFRHRLEWRHDEKRLLAHGPEPFPARLPAISRTPLPLPAILRLGSPMDRPRYLALVRQALGAIENGEFYQVNLTRKFEGEFASPPDGPALFLSLTAASPAPYGAYLRFGKAEILSSSPELFLRAGEDGRIESRPIKGTRRRSPMEADDAGRRHLLDSAKDRAENLMIVDLVRNDLSRICEPRSVHVPALFEAESFRTLHHLSSSVAGKLAEGRTVIDAVKAAFPPGSMTGAPKIAAQRWCAGAEAIDRGIYSGALGWIGSNMCELSVVIRTLVLEGTRFEFQVGGGIVAESAPEKEWQETLTKAQGIVAALGLPADYLAKI